MAKNEEALNDYRAERKARIAKAAKQKNKNHGDSTLAARIVIYVISAAICVALIIAGLFYFGVPQKFMTAVKVGDKSYSYAEYNYFYSSVYQNLVSTAEEQKNSYGFSLFDTSAKLDVQEYVIPAEEGKEEEKITYAEYIDREVISTLEQSNYYLGLAKEKGLTLDKEHSDEIQATIDSITQYAEQYGYSESRYISLLYGKGMNLKNFRKMLEEQYLVAQYLESVQDDFSVAIPEEDIEAKYTEAPNDYNVVDIRLFGIKVPDENAEETEGEEVDPKLPKTKEDAEQNAKTFLSRLTDEASFKELAKEYASTEDQENGTFDNDSATLVRNVKFSLVNSQISEEIAEWLFSADRKAGDKNTVTTDTYVYVIYVVNPAYRNEDCLVDARHILISFDSVKAELDAANAEAADGTEETAEEEIKVETGTADDGTEISNEGTDYSLPVVLEAYKKAHKILTEDYAQAETEENFGELAEKYSSDTGSIGEAGEGGLYTSIEKGKMVSEFENWVYDETRVPGDTGIIRTEYGYHVMYFVQKHEEPTWKEDVRLSIANTKAEEFQTAAEAEYKDTAVKAFFGDYAYKKALEMANNLIEAQNG